MKKTQPRGPAATPEAALPSPDLGNPLYILRMPDMNALFMARLRLKTANAGLRGISLLLKCCHPDLPMMFPDQWRALLEPIGAEVEAALDEVTHLPIEMRFTPPPPTAPA